MTSLFAVALLLGAVPQATGPNTGSPPTPVAAVAADPCWMLQLPPGCAIPPPPPPPPPPTVTVQYGDTLSALALAWGVDLTTVIAANVDQVPNPDWIEPGQVLRMPGGTPPPPSSSPPTFGGGAGTAAAIRPAPGAVGNHFTFGYCTWYVANKRPIPWFGDAGQWGPNAAAMGFPEGRSPRVGAIMVTWEGPIGHVAYVERVNADGSWVVSEMNYNAWDVVDWRTIRPGTIPLETFIY